MYYPHWTQEETAIRKARWIAVRDERIARAHTAEQRATADDPTQIALIVGYTLGELQLEWSGHEFAAQKGAA